MTVEEEYGRLRLVLKELDDQPHGAASAALLVCAAFTVEHPETWGPLATFIWRLAQTVPDDMQDTIHVTERLVQIVVVGTD